jgi:ubiquitin carboxyl-terminal hydrolase 12/46
MKRLPQILALHLKRFKYMEELQRYKKLSYRVDFPIELSLQTTADERDVEERYYKVSGLLIDYKVSGLLIDAIDSLTRVGSKCSIN